ncbi:Pentatricopeptide repeat-containing protein At1g77405 [Linum perenne]
MLQARPFDATLTSATTSATLLTADLVSNVLRSIPRFFFLSPRSIGRQNTTRHRSPIKQRNLEVEYCKRRDGFQHTESTCRDMAIVLVRGNKLDLLWEFLREMSGRGNGRVSLVTTMTVTCLMKVLGEEGLVKQALALFYRMKQYHCKPDVYAYNTIIYALCRVGNFKKARDLLQQMELPGFRCPPDTFTYTILISSYCKYSLQTGCRKAIRRRLWEANHLFRLMLFNGFVPDLVTYNCLIDGCCKTHRIERATELFEDMSKRGCVPNRVTYDSFIRYYSVVNEIDKAVEMLRMMQKMNHGLLSSSSYTPIIHALCEAGRASEAWEFLVELVNGGSIPREYTYKLVCDALGSAGEDGLPDDELHNKIKEGIDNRFRDVKKAVLKAEDILNYWPDAEVGRVLGDYGEESNWQVLQNKIVLARSNGDIHSTAELIDLVRGVMGGAKGSSRGRPGWIKTATRVFQALRIAVNDELNTLEKALKDSFGCLAPGGRLSVISFHSLEDRIVKQTFLSIIEAAGSGGDVDREDYTRRDFTKTSNDTEEKETWIRQTVRG